MSYIYLIYTLVKVGSSNVRSWRFYKFTNISNEDPNFNIHVPDKTVFSRRTWTWSGMNSRRARAVEPELPSQKFNFVFSLNRDTWIYICDVILLLGLNAITHTNNSTTTRIILNLWTFWQATWYKSHGHGFRLFYRFASNKTYLRIHYHYQSKKNTSSEILVLTYICLK